MENNYVEKLDFFLKKELRYTKNKESLSSIIKNKIPIIYGAGAGGLYAKYLLSLEKIEPYIFLDMNAKEIKEIEGIKVFEPKNDILSEEEKRESIVIIGVGNQRAKIEIEKMLKEDGYTNIISYIEVFNEFFLMADNVRLNLIDTDFYYKNKEDILDVISYLEDDESKKIYHGFIKGHILKANEFFVEPTEYDKYFPEGIEFSKGYDCFIDCGATKGETYKILEKKNIIPKTLVMFEPDMKNFSELINFMSVKNQKTFLYPSLVYSKTKKIGFIQSGTQGSSVSVENENTVQGVALDDILKNIEPTFIKMDIEGSEYEAILGARKIITEYKPDLAICVYHAVNHIWDIPILLRQLNPKYKFYLRSGNFFGMNTILYAVT